MKFEHENVLLVKKCFEVLLISDLLGLTKSNI